MPSRKKRLLFDVLDNVFEPADEFDKKPRAKRSSGSRAKSRIAKPKSRRKSLLSSNFGPKKRQGEFNLSIEKAGAIGLVMIVLIAVAYQIGIGHSDDGGNDKKSLSRNSAGLASEFNRSRPHFAVKAKTLRFGEFTIDDAKEEAALLLNLLWDEGYGDAIHTRLVHDEDGRNGKIILWAGHADSRKELEEEARAIRALQSEGTTPFKDAYITLFSAPK